MRPKSPAVKISAVNDAIMTLAGRRFSKAKAILAQFGVTRTPELKREDYQAVIDAANAERAKLDTPPAPKTSPALLQEFNIEGHPVQCHEFGGHRLWRCDCPCFQRTLAVYSEGFCPHLVVAIGIALRDGTMDLGFAVRPTSKKPG